MMSNIDNKALALCPRGTDLVALHADRTTWVQNINTPAGIDAMLNFAQGACILRGEKKDDAGLRLTSSALWEEIRADFPTLSIAEIGYAIKAGCFEKYGSVYGVNAVSLYKMVRGYVASEEAQDIRRKAQERANSGLAKTREWLAQHPEYKSSTLGR